MLRSAPAPIAHSEPGKSAAAPAWPHDPAGGPAAAPGTQASDTAELRRVLIARLTQIGPGPRPSQVEAARFDGPLLGAPPLDSLVRLRGLLTEPLDGAMVDFALYLRQLCMALAGSLGFAGRIELLQDAVESCRVPRSEASRSLALIVAEAVTNAIRHAHPTGVTGTIRVKCRRDREGAVAIGISDDGVGLPEGFDPARNGNFGFEAMRRLAASLRSGLSCKTSSLGLRIRVRVPTSVLGRQRDHAATATSARTEPGLPLAGTVESGKAPGEAPDAAISAAPVAAPSPPSDATFRQVLEILPAAVYATDAHGRITFFNAAAVELWGHRPAPGDLWCGSWRMYWPDGRPMRHDQCPMAVALKEDRAVRGHEAIAERPDGARVPFLAFPTPLHDAAGRLIGAVNMLVDISERRRAEERQRLLTDEMHHRTKNMFAVARAIVAQGLRGNRSLGDARAAVLGRLHALAATYDKLMATGWQGADLDGVVRTELTPFAERVVIDGPPVLLNARAAQNFGLAVHELATNAAKHGALSVPSGRVVVRWWLTGDNGEARLQFHWAEQGGPPVKPPPRKGFGSVVIEQVVAQDFDRPPKVEFAPSGLTYELVVALHTIAGTEAAAQG